MAAVVGIGETLVRFTPSGGETLESTAACAVHVGGAESNVCAGLAQLGVETAWISRLPVNPLGRRIAAAVRSFGVNTDGVLWARDGHAGLMFVQPGTGPRAGEVIYYRRGSAFTGIDPDAVGWHLLDGARAMHLTGITPALGERPHRLVERAMAEARQRGIRVCFDVNYRAKLWAPAAARETLEPLLAGVDVLVLNERDAGGVFGAQGDPEDIAGALRRRFGCGVLVLTLGSQGAIAQDEAGTTRQQAFPTEIIDRIGRGDAFTAGFLYGYLAQGTVAGLRYGAALAALKQTYSGDVCRASLDEVEAVLQGASGGFHR